MSQYALKREIVGTAAEYILKASEGVEQIIEFFQSGREDIATRMMIDLVEGIEWLTQAIDGTKDIHGDHPMDISQANSVLREISEAYENMDYVLLSDLLEYELLPMVNIWRKQLTSIKGVLDNDNATE
ncbi:hypothetical protein [Acetivibrio mesophilus]|uniref:DUF8042 domain-containing protein n=1 Tax=Acetivibrio mesophilus TaxID=2487273 RepID=A0A4Q0I765_9FIRM|nr:hypothetical protein [Acetivibrio mesophilus]ODM27331.1 hypothetical protein A7W90_14525 [Clostridium sp. Bc-iso-3]RXE58832.1 hypothetical protein EFD62_10230 [Acetivibrio mesophilus]HHV28934.1 hypothetical protein [Clostridium sp.]